MSQANRDARLARKREEKRLKRKGVSGKGHHGSSPAAPLPAPPSISPGTNRIAFDIRYNHGGTLAKIGPMIEAEWSVPLAVADELRRTGKPVPEPVKGTLLIDTGAGGTCIAEHAATELGLPKVGTAKMFGAHGQQESTRYMARLNIRLQQGAVAGGIIRESTVAGIPGMQESASQFGVKDGSGQPINLIGVLGREFLQHCHMTYNGPAGVIHIEVDMQSMQAAPIRAMTSSPSPPPPVPLSIPVSAGGAIDVVRPRVVGESPGDPVKPTDPTDPPA